MKAGKSRIEVYLVSRKDKTVVAGGGVRLEKMRSDSLV
jgi:hypothetical protein